MSELIAVPIAKARPIAGFRPLRRALPGETAAAVPECQAATDPFDEGYRKGHCDAEETFAAERARYRALLAASEAFQPEPSEPLALLIAESVEMLVRHTVGDVAIDGATLIARAKRAAALVSELDSAQLLHVHPDDLPLLDDDSLPLPVVADPSITRGSLRVEHATGWIEDGVAVRLDALREQLGLREQAE